MVSFYSKENTAENNWAVGHGFPFKMLKQNTEMQHWTQNFNYFFFMFGYLKNASFSSPQIMCS